MNIRAQTNCKRIYNEEVEVNNALWADAFSRYTNDLTVPRNEAAGLAHMEVLAYRAEHPFPWLIVEPWKPSPCNEHCSDECGVKYVKPV